MKNIRYLTLFIVVFGLSGLALAQDEKSKKGYELPSISEMTGSGNVTCPAYSTQKAEVRKLAAGTPAATIGDKKDVVEPKVTGEPEKIE